MYKQTFEQDSLRADWKQQLVKWGFFALVAAATFPAHANCRKISSPWNDYPLILNPPGELVISRNTPVGTPLAQITVSGNQLYGVNGGWFATCDNIGTPTGNRSDMLTNWWLEVHYSASRGFNPIAGVVSDAPGGNMYVLQDNGAGNPYGGLGSGAIGYATQLDIAGGSSYAFEWLPSGANKNLPALPAPVTGIPCAQVADGSSGYPILPNACSVGKFLVNWRMMPAFSIKMTVYRLAGKIPAAGLQIQNNYNEGQLLFSFMNGGSTAPNWNTDVFNLVRPRWPANWTIRQSPCGQFPAVNVDMGKVSASSFVVLGKPASGVADKQVNITAQCDASVSTKWAVLGNPDPYDATGAQGILQLDPVANAASGVGIQLMRKDGITPVPLSTPASLTYNYVDDAITSDSNGNLTLTFGARYVRTSAVTPGTANSHATILIAPK